MNDIVRLFGDSGWPEQSPALVAAALALMNGVPRVVVAPTLAGLGDCALIACGGETDVRALIAARSDGETSTLLVDLMPDVSAAEVGAARARGVRFVHPGGSVLLPGQRRASKVGGAALALPLLFGHPRLGALIELLPAPIERGLVEAGVLHLVTITPPRSGPRVVLPLGVSPIASEPALEPPTSGPTARLEAALGELTRRFTHRLGRDRGAVATLEREAERVLQGEVAAGAITGYALVVEPRGDDLAIEVAVTLPKRVGQVIIRVSQV